MALEKEILQIDGDASGASQAAQQAVDAIKKTADATDQLGASQKSAEAVTQAVASAQQRQQQVTDRAAAATRDQAGAFEGASQKANVLAKVLSKVDPRLGDLVRTGGSLGNVLEAAFSPTGLMTGGLVAALAAVSAIIATVQADIAKAKRDLEDMEAAKARAARGKLEAAGEVGKALATHGAGSESAVDRATEQVQKTETEGFERSTAVKVAAATEAAGVSLTDDDRRRLAMGVQLGAVDIGGRTAAETAASIKEAMDKLANMGPDLQAALEGAIQQTMRGANLGKLREATQGTQGILEEVLQGMGYEGDTLKEKAANVRASLKGVPRKTQAFGGGMGFAAPVEGVDPEEYAAYVEGRELLDKITQQIEDKQKQLAGQQERVRRFAAQAQPGQQAESKAWGETFAEQPGQPDPAAEAEARRREQVQSILGQLETSAQKATLSPEDFLRSRLQELGATEEEITRALDLQRKADANKESGKPSRPARPARPGTQAPKFNPDAQNQAPVVNNHYSGIVYQGGFKDPSENMATRSPVR